MYVNSPGGSVTAGNIEIGKPFPWSFVLLEIGTGFVF